MSCKIYPFVRKPKGYTNLIKEFWAKSGNISLDAVARVVDDWIKEEGFISLKKIM